MDSIQIAPRPLYPSTVSRSKDVSIVFVFPIDLRRTFFRFSDRLAPSTPREGGKENVDKVEEDTI